MGDDPFLSEPMFSITVVENTLGVLLCLKNFYLVCASCQILFLLTVMQSQGDEAVQNHDLTGASSSDPQCLTLSLGSLWWRSHSLPVTAP